MKTLHKKFIFDTANVKKLIGYVSPLICSPQKIRPTYIKTSVILERPVFKVLKSLSIKRQVSCERVYAQTNKRSSFYLENN